MLKSVILVHHLDGKLKVCTFTYIHTTFCMLQGAALMDRYSIFQGAAEEPLLQLGHCEARCEELQQVVKTSEEVVSPAAWHGMCWSSSIGKISGSSGLRYCILNYFEYTSIKNISVYTVYICFHVSIVFPPGPWFLMLLLPSYHDVGLGWLGKCWFKLSDVRRPWAKGGCSYSKCDVLYCCRYRGKMENCGDVSILFVSN